MTKIFQWVGKLMVIAAIPLAGCGKASQALPPVTINGVAINIDPFQQAFASASPDLLNGVTRVRLSINYGDFPTALGELTTLAGNTTLTESQKQAVEKLTQQVNQASAKATTAAQ